MKKIIIDKNENEQRIDRFLKKYLDKAPVNFIQKMLRKKNIILNGKKSQASDIIYEGDEITLFLSDETIEKFRTEKEHVILKNRLDIVYEDNNIVAFNKPRGMLSHGTGKAFEENAVDNMISYLIEKGDYIPRLEKTFTPAISNRLDRNTSGILIACKNYYSLKAVNNAMKNLEIDKYYYTLVFGEFKEEIEKKAFIRKDEYKNITEVFDKEKEGSKNITTVFKPLESKNGFTFLEVKLITGRTHQIRSQLSAMGYYIVGDEKYGDKKKNLMVNNFRGQFLHCGLIVLGGLEGELEYLNGLELKAKMGRKLTSLKEDLMGGNDEKKLKYLMKQ